MLNSHQIFFVLFLTFIIVRTNESHPLTRLHDSLELSCELTINKWTPTEECEARCDAEGSKAVCNPKVPGNCYCESNK